MLQELTTARLRLRALTVDDARDLAALHGDPRVMRHLDDGRPVPPEEIRDRTLPAMLARYRELPEGLGHRAAVARDGGAFLGWFEFGPVSSAGLHGGRNVVELGYRLFPSVWGRGLATEGARALVDHGFATLGVERVVATTMSVNAASRRVMEKTGLVWVRTFFVDWPEPLPGAEQGEVEYALTREEWERDRAGRRPGPQGHAPTAGAER
ncbi:GNAT family N-acetyltransferase [Streptomyces hoynatensis]|uniref:N-acetyltransferase n=1 Tax=Streptomyces hoynatensis TaxID=1141874 RepID=A0A3A9YNX4_9ACTN|nr:GNAT family N-acetyltransferase [Streptomyces hoynatensis]RKN37773.1 N-acetyltransferase [Streptomyces hoynatensis]